MFSPAGVIIYKAFAPTLKMALVIGAGFGLAKRGVFPPQAAKGLSVVAMNIGLPSLIFSSMVAAFTPQNITAFGPLAMVSVIYQVLGGLLAWLVRELVYVPQDFQWGIIVLGMISNWGNLPTAVVQVLALASPFNPDTDVELGVAYVAIFVLIQNTVFFACGLHKVCAWDFREDQMALAPLPFKERWAGRLAAVKGLFNGNKQEEEEVVDVPRKTGKSRSRSISSVVVQSDRAPPPSPKVADQVDNKRPLSMDSESNHGEEDEEPSNLNPNSKFVGGSVPTRKTSRTPSFSSMMDSTKRIHPTEPLEASGIATIDLHYIQSPVIDNNDKAAGTLAPIPLLPIASINGQAYSYHQAKSPTPSIHRNKVYFIVDFVKNFFSVPASIAVVISLPCALIQPLKALFTDVSGVSGSTIPYAPDGKPPLSFVLSTASFLGGLSVPAGLILLGASFARLKMPKRWKELPLLAIFSMMTVKMIIIPIFGVFFIQALAKQTTLFPPSEKIRTFVAILLSGTPAAVNQLVITQLYNPAGTAHTLAYFLLLQYLMMFSLSTALAAIALYIVET